MDNHDNEKGVMLSVLAGIGIGVLVGAVAGLLLAPRPGTQTRESLGTTLKDLGTKIGDLSQEVASKVKTAVEHGRDAVEECLEKKGTEGSGPAAT
ncbi:MAG TPA: YtxH domain-containing protein [Chthonomonadales bacterium]|nr:YtxH domain-containing protein [Chthonomonadales bacterium]